MNTYDQDFWQSLWQRTLATHGDKVRSKRPHGLLVEVADGLQPGRALDAGCGHGAEALHLAQRGWTVLGVDFSQAALDHLEGTVAALGEPMTARVRTLQADLGEWAPEPALYDLVVCLYVHVAGAATAQVERLASGVAVGGTLLLSGHQPVDPTTGAPTRASGQTQVTLDEALAVLDPAAWTLHVAEHRARASGGGVDAVVVAQRIR